MIIPRLSQAEWWPRFRDATLWSPSAAPMVVIVPHPDDETLALGGLIAAQRAKGVDVTIVAVTDGEHAYQQNQGLAARRREEQKGALARLGVPVQKILRLGFVDSGVSHQEHELVAAIQPLITADTVVFAPWSGDFHPDHEACARAAKAVTESTGATLISYFFWTWHRGTLETVATVALQTFALTEPLMIAKQEALACHVSQLTASSEPEILPENLLWPARMPFEVFTL